MGDDIGDRLRLACAGRSFEHEVVAGGGGENRCKLGGIRTARAEDFARMKLVVQLLRPNVLWRVWIRLASLVNQVVDNAVTREVVETISEVFPEQELGEGELAQPDLSFDLPTGEATHCFAEELENTGHVHAASIFGQRVEAGNLLLELLPEHLHQGDIEARFLINPAEREPLKHGFAL